MKKILFSLFCILTCSSLYAEEHLKTNEGVDATYIITECGKAVQVPGVNYTPDQVDALITIYTEAMCKKEKNE